ncbi:transcriptional regulator [Streptomyces sp. CNQ-509]|uniref:LacI family DNA-binding transcriptional regulator n=1 Tax=unclassified Streptomyces TaxID=2593676 RepID=UPI00062DE51F|nr:LacI family DNA-binding transcriptional regulator [Streptomyces sp. CNQ-509]AKH85711.1 transcriptional regulator [Streptomyces sp. CNQ-509]
MVTIGDIAHAAGVSRSTASYALSGKRSISAEVRQRVADAARELGYTPNAGARALATAETMVLGLLAQFHEDEFAPAMLQYMLGVSDTARELGYDTLLVTEADGARALRRITDSRMVDGVVLLNVAQDDARLPLLRDAPQPGALVGLPGDPTGVDVFDLDFEAAGRAMVDHMHRLHHRELILVSQPEHVIERGGAYVWRLQDAVVQQARFRGIRLHAAFGFSRQPGVGRHLSALLDAHPAATGLLLNNEAAAAALPSVLHARGLRVSRDLSVIGRYSDEFARTFSLPFSSIESAPDLLGALAVRQLVSRLVSPAARDEPHVLRLVPPELVDRGSTGAPPADPSTARAQGGTP